MTKIPLIEPIAVSDIYVSGLAPIEDAGGGALRFTFYVAQHSLQGDKGLEHSVVARLVVPADKVGEMVNAANEAIANLGIKTLIKRTNH